MKRWMMCCGVMVMVGCGESEPASVSDMGMNPPVTTPRDMATTPPGDSGTQPQPDLGQPGIDQGSPGQDMQVTGGDQGNAADQGSPDMSMMDMPIDQGGGGQSRCGNEVIEPGELCDGNCPTSCDDGNACTTDTMAGAANTCNVVCVNQPGGSCGPTDGCCPSGCTEAMDEDCSQLAMLDCSDASSWPAAWTQLEDAVVAEVNRRRAMGGSCGATAHPPAPALTFAPALREAGRCHALDMVRRDYFANRSPEGESGLDRAQAAGYTGAQSVGQDIGTHATALELVNNWMTREGNCNHILNARYDEIGVGFMESTTSMYPRYWVQVVADKP